MQNQDYEYFLQNMENFYKIYGQKFVAIKDRRVLGAYDSFNDALNATLKTEKAGTFLIQECFEKRENCMNFFQGNVLFSPA